MNEEQQLAPEQQDFYDWLASLDLDIPASELIEPAWLEQPQIDAQELDYLDASGREYAQELLERDIVPDLPSVKHEEPMHIAEEPDHSPDRDHDR